MSLDLFVRTAERTLRQTQTEQAANATQVSPPKAQHVCQYVPKTRLSPLLTLSAFAFQVSSVK